MKTAVSFDVTPCFVLGSCEHFGVIYYLRFRVKETCPKSTLNSIRKSSSSSRLKLKDEYFSSGSTALMDQGLLIVEVSILHSTRHTFIYPR